MEAVKFFVISYKEKSYKVSSAEIWKKVSEKHVPDMYHVKEKIVWGNHSPFVNWELSKAVITGIRLAINSKTILWLVW